jgi:transposase
MSQVIVDSQLKLKNQVIDLARGGASLRIIAVNSGVPKTTVARWINEAKEAGEFDLIAESGTVKSKKTGHPDSRKNNRASPASQNSKKTVPVSHEETEELTPLKRLQLIRSITDQMLWRMKNATEEDAPLLPYKAKDIRDINNAIKEVEASFENLKEEITIAVTEKIYNLLRVLPDEIQTQISEVLSAQLGI